MSLFINILFFPQTIDLDYSFLLCILPLLLSLTLLLLFVCIQVCGPYVGPPMCKHARTHVHVDVRGLHQMLATLFF